MTFQAAGILLFTLLAAGCSEAFLTRMTVPDLDSDQCRSAVRSLPVPPQPEAIRQRSMGR